MILLLRHGETHWNVERRIQGRTESDLTARGERQARAMAALAAELVGRKAGPWRLVSSPIGRARRTADAVALATGLPVELDERLAELSCGAWEGRLHAEIARDHPEHYAKNWVYGAPGGETYEDVRARAASFLADLPPEPQRRVVVVSHGVLGRLMRGVYAGLTREATLAQPVPQDAVYRLSQGQVDRFDCDPAEV